MLNLFGKPSRGKQSILLGLLFAAFVLAAVGVLSDLVEKPAPTRAPAGPSVPKETREELPDGSAIVRGVDFERKENPGGASGTTSYYSAPINYFDRSDGRYKPIDPTIRPSDADVAYPYEMTANAFTLAFKKNATDPDAVRFTVGDASITYTFGAFAGQEPKPVEAKVDGATLTYPGLYDGVDLRYTVTNTALVEEFVASKPFELDPIVQTVRVVNASFRQDEAGNVVFVNTQTNEPLWTVPHPLMYEDKDRAKTSDGLQYELAGSGAQFTFTRTFNDAGRLFLADASYPVAIDGTTGYLPATANNKAFKGAFSSGGFVVPLKSYTELVTEFSTASPNEYSNVGSDNNVYVSTQCGFGLTIGFCLVQHNFRFLIGESANRISKLTFTHGGYYSENHPSLTDPNFEKRAEIRTDNSNDNPLLRTLTTADGTGSVVLDMSAGCGSPPCGSYYLDDSGYVYFRAFARNTADALPTSTGYNLFLYSDYAKVDVQWIDPLVNANFEPVSFTTTQTKFFWVDNSTVEVKWKVERSLDGVSGWTQIPSGTSFVWSGGKDLIGILGDFWDCTNTNSFGQGTTKSSTDGYCTYIDGGLSVDTKYYYRVSTIEDLTLAEALPKAVVHNGTGNPYAYTRANTPGTPTLSNSVCGGSHGLTYVLDYSGGFINNPATTQYATFVQYNSLNRYSKTYFVFPCTPTHALDPAVTYETRNPIDGLFYPDQLGTDLPRNTLFTFSATARNGDGVVTASSPTATRYTYIEPPTGVEVNAAGIGATTIQARATGTFTNLTTGTSGVTTCVTPADGGNNDCGAAVTTWPTWSQSTGYQTLSGLTPNTLYTFRAASRNAEATVDATQNPTAASVTQRTRAAQPGSITISNKTATSYTVSWLNSPVNPSATEYRIQVFIPDFEFGGDIIIHDSGWISDPTPPALTCSPSPCAYTGVTGLSPNVGYYVRVLARNADNISTNFSCYNASGATTCNGDYVYTLANAPASVTVTCAYDATNQYNCQLTWPPPGGGGNPPTRYSIYRSDTTSAGACPATAIYKQWADNVTASPFTDANLLTNRKYCYQIGGYNAQQAPSATLSTVGSDVTPTAQVTGLTHTANTTSSITWQWNRIVGVTYKIYDVATNTEIPQASAPVCSAITGKCTWSQVEHRNGTGPPYSLLQNTQYGVFVVATNTNGDGQPSSSVTAYTSIEAPTGVTFGSPSELICGNGCINSTTIDVKAAGTFSNLSSGTSGTFIRETDSDGVPLASSGWRLTSNPFWSAGPYAVNSRHYFQAQARNAEGNDACTSGTGDCTAFAKSGVNLESHSTLALPPQQPGLRREAPSFMVTTIQPDSNDAAPEPVEYAIVVSTDGVTYNQCATASGGVVTLSACQIGSAEAGHPNGRLRDGGGALLGDSFWNTKTEWDTADGSGLSGSPGMSEFKVSGLNPGMTYWVTVRSRNGAAGVADDDVETASSVPSQLFLVKNNTVGWLWSSNVGWISLNCLNFKKDASGSANGMTCSSSDHYGVNADVVSGRGVNPLSGHAWSPQAGWLTLDYNEATDNGTKSPPEALPDCSGSSVPNCLAMVNGVTREFTGWARVLAEKEHGEALGFDDWGWVKLSGKWGAGVNDRYLWSLLNVDSLDFLNITGGEPELFSAFGWAWDRTVVASDAGWGWVQARGQGSVVDVPYLQTFFGDIYSRSQIRLAPPPRGLGSTCGPSGTEPCETSTYLILANGDIQGISGFFPTTITGPPTSALQQAPLTPVSPNYPVSPNAIQNIPVDDLTTFRETPATVGDHEEGKDRFGHTLWRYANATNKTASDLWPAYPAALGNRVVYVRGDLTLNDPVADADLDPITFRNDGGAGLVAVDGDLHVRTNVAYGSESLNGKKLIDFGSVSFLVKGNIYIDPAVSSLVGAYVGVGENGEDGGIFSASRAYRASGATDDAQAGASFSNAGASLNAGWKAGAHETAYFRFGPIDLPAKVCSNDVSVTCAVVGDCPAASPSPICGVPAVGGAEVRFESSGANASSFRTTAGTLGTAPFDGESDHTPAFSADPRLTTEIIGDVRDDIGVCSQNPLNFCLADADCGTGNTCTVPWAAGERHATPNIASLLTNFVSRVGYAQGSDYFGVALRHEAPGADPGSDQFREFKSFDGAGIRGERPVFVAHYSLDGKPLTVSGLMIARQFTFERRITANLQPAERVVYDGRVVANTPPGLEDFLKALPTYQQVVP